MGAVAGRSEGGWSRGVHHPIGGMCRECILIGLIERIILFLSRPMIITLVGYISKGIGLT